MTKLFILKVRISGVNGVRIYTGRDGWALNELISAGPNGVTPITHPAPRWSAYIHNLRNTGIAIETIHEPHKGPFPGTHGRYVLKSDVTLVPANDDEDED